MKKLREIIIWVWISVAIFLILEKCTKPYDLLRLPSVDLEMVVVNLNQLSLTARIVAEGNNTGLNDLEILDRRFRIYLEDGSFERILTEANGVSTDGDRFMGMIDGLDFSRTYLLEASIRLPDGVISSDILSITTDSLGLDVHNMKLSGSKITFTSRFIGLMPGIVPDGYGHCWIVGDEKTEDLTPEALYAKGDKTCSIKTAGLDSPYEFSDMFELRPGENICIVAYAVFGSQVILSTSVADTTYGDFWAELPGPVTIDGTPVRAADAVAFSVGNFGFFGTGRNPSLEPNSRYSKAFYRFDPAAGLWSGIAEFPGSGRYDAVAFVLGDTAYVGGGRDGETSYRDFYAYDYREDNWRATQSLPVALYGSISFSFEDVGYIGMGCGQFRANDCLNLPTPCQLSDAFFKYQPENPPNNKWVEQAASPVPLADVVSFVIDDKGYVITGLSTRGFPAPGQELSSVVLAFDPLTGGWSRLGDFSGTKRANAIGFAVNDQGYVITGWDCASKNVSNDFYVYHPQELVWRPIATLPNSASIYSSASFVVNGNVYVISGFAAGNPEIPVNRMWLYFP